MKTVFTAMIGPTTMLLAGLGITGVTWAGQGLMNPAVSLARPGAVETGQNRHPDGLYEYFHNAELHKPDGLGNYSEDYRRVKTVHRQVETPSVVEQHTASPASLYQYFHNAALHKPDGLGNYAQNMRLVHPR